jgi:hypothetical protein
MNKFKPGTGVRFFNTCTDNLGVLTDPSSPVVTIKFPDGTTVTPTPVRDSLGMWHADALIPITMQDGIGVERWQSSGASIMQDGLEERRFQVVRLDF